MSSGRRGGESSDGGGSDVLPISLSIIIAVITTIIISHLSLKYYAVLLCHGHVILSRSSNNMLLSESALKKEGREAENVRMEGERIKQL